MSASDALLTAALVLGSLIALYVVWMIVRRRLSDQIVAVVSRLVPVVVLVVLLLTALVVVDPDRGDEMLDAAVSYLPRAVIAIVVLIVARGLGAVLRALTETALRPVSPLLAARSGLAVAGVLVAVGVIIALQQLGVSTDILMLLVAGLVFATALAASLLIGLGGLPLAKQVAAGRHVQERYREGQVIRVDGHEGRIVSIGLSTTRIESADGGVVDLPNRTLLEHPVTRLS